MEEKVRLLYKVVFNPCWHPQLPTRALSDNNESVYIQTDDKLIADVNVSY